MNPDPFGSTYDISDPLMMAHIRDHTDLIVKFADAKGSPNSTAFDHDEFNNFAMDEIFNEAISIETYECSAYRDSDETYLHMVMEYQGIYFYSTLEDSMVAFWLDKSLASAYAEGAANP